MADRKLTELPEATAVNSGDKMYLVRDSETNVAERSKQVDVDDIKRFVEGAAAAAQVALVDGTNIAWNVASAPNAVITLRGNRTMSAPSNPATGAFYVLLVRQDGTGGRTLAWHSTYEFAFIGGSPTVSAGANEMDLFLFMRVGGNMVCLAHLEDI